MTPAARLARFVLILIAVSIALQTIAALLRVSPPAGVCGIAAYPLTILIVRLLEPTR